MQVGCDTVEMCSAEVNQLQALYRVVIASRGANVEKDWKSIEFFSSTRLLRHDCVYLVVVW